MEKIFANLISLFPGEGHGEKVNVKTENGIITEVFTGMPDTGDTQAKKHITDCSGCFISPGFTDTGSALGTDGLDSTESISSLCEAAAAGGYTQILLQPISKIPVESPEQVIYIKIAAQDKAVNIYPVGALSEGYAAERLTELAEMMKSGAIAFSNGDKAVQHDEFMSRLLAYAKGVGARIMVRPENMSLAGKAIIAEGDLNVLLGMKGIPALAEELQILRDIKLSEYHDYPLHFNGVGTAQGVEAIRQAKARGVKVTCDTPAANLYFNEQVLMGFNSNYKVRPALRSEENRQALLAGVADGTIDAVSSQHRPVSIEHKLVELEAAQYGMLQLQTVYSMLNMLGMAPETIVRVLAVRPRELFNIPLPVLREGEKAEFTIFNTTEEWVYDGRSNKSNSINSPLMGKTLRGRVKAVAGNNKINHYE